MAIAVVNSEIGTGTGADPSVYTLGFTPTTGNSLLVAVRIFSTPFDTGGMTDSGSNTWVQDLEYSSGEWRYYRCQSIGTVPTTISIDQSGTVFTFFIVLECTGIDSTNPVDNTSDETAHGPASTAHTRAYTTNYDGGLVFGTFEESSDADYTGASGTSVLVRDNAEARGGLYKVVTTAESGNLNWDSVTSEGPDSGLVVYRGAADATTYTHYYGVYTSGNGASATDANVKAGTGTGYVTSGSQAGVDSGTEQSFTVTGLTASTDYDLEWVVNDGSEDTRATSTPFSTKAANGSVVILSTPPIVRH